MCSPTLMKERMVPGPSACGHIRDSDVRGIDDGDKNRTAMRQKT